ncbi:MAG: diguanylate cyclase [Armatimonadetes bacterium]|nr:diguanylate cyclase [Armatimonadota bacterium]
MFTHHLLVAVHHKPGRLICTVAVEHTADLHFPLLVLQLVNMQARDFILKNLLVFAAMGGAATYILFRLSSVEKEKTELTERFHKDRRLAIEAFEEQQEEKKGFLERIEELHRELDSRKQALFQIQETQAQKSEETSREMEERSQRIERLETLLRALREFVPSPHLDELFSGFTEMLGNHLPLDTCVLFLPEEEEGKIRFMAELAVSNYVEYFKNYSVSPGEEAVGWVAVQKTPLLIAEGTHITPERQELSTILASEKSALLAPLMIQDELLGVLYVSHTKPSRYTPWDLEFLTHFTSLIAPALLLAHHYQQAVSTGVHDGVTGLYNNLYFRERLAEEFRRANRYEHPLSLIMVDVDRFQRFNASYGERFGDFLLRELGELLKGYLRDVDVCARLGNDQFAILLIQADKSNAILIAERIRLAIEMRAFGAAARQKVRITASMGVASFPQDARAKEDLLEKGAKSLAIAQKKGGNNTSFAA